MTKFSGFSDVKPRNSPFPDEFFSELLNEIQDLDEFKVTIYILWFLSKREKNSQWISWKDITSDDLFISGFAKNKEQAVKSMLNGLVSAIKRGTILSSKPALTDLRDCVFVLNSQLGKATLKGLTSNNIVNPEETGTNIPLERDRPNIFSLYEQHIGPLTPMISETLQAAEKEYPDEWFSEAMLIAVKNNVRRWTYIEAILKRWKQEGRNEKERGNHKEDRRKYIEGQYNDIIKH